MSDIQIPPPEANETPSMRQLREAYDRAMADANAAREEATTNAAAARELVFVKAKVKNDPMGAYFMQTYQGELTEEAVKAAAGALGLIEDESAPPPPPPPPPGGEQQLSPEELRQQQERAALAAGGGDAGKLIDEDPKEAGLKAFNDALARGETRERAASEYFHRLADAGVKGDDRVIWTPEKHMQKVAKEG